MTTFTLHYDDAPPSLNRIGTRGSRHAVTREKKRWEGLMGMLLISARVPKGQVFVRARATMRWPDKRRRDIDNYQWLLVKALGDALQTVGIIADDTPDQFEFTSLRFEEEKGPRRVTVQLEMLDARPHDD